MRNASGALTIRRTQTMMNNNNAINDADLGNVSGGLIFNATNISGSDPSRPWEVIDNKNGNVIDRFARREDAVARAQQFGGNPYNAMEVDWNQVVSLRNNPIA